MTFLKECLGDYIFMVVLVISGTIHMKVSENIDYIMIRR